MTNPNLSERLANKAYDAIVIGAGPNGLAAAITIARRQRTVLVLEAQPTLGGGARSAELTLPGYLHDVCSAIHPMGVSSPFFRSVPLAEHGLTWIHPYSPVAHPLDDGTAAILERSVDQTASTLGPDAASYRRLMGPLTNKFDDLIGDTLGPLSIPRHPLLLAQFGLQAIHSASGLANAWFRGAPARALIAGLAGHSILPLEQTLSAAVPIMLGVAGHAVGWPLPRGGSQSITNAMVSYLQSLGGEVFANSPVKSL